MVAETAAQGELPLAVIWIVNESVSLEPWVYWAVNWFALVKVPFDVPTVDHNIEAALVAVADAVYTVSWQTVSVGAVVTVGALVMFIVISSKSVNAHKASDWATNRKVTEFEFKSAAEKL